MDGSCGGGGANKNKNKTKETELGETKEEGVSSLMSVAIHI